MESLNGVFIQNMTTYTYVQYMKWSLYFILQKKYPSYDSTPTIGLHAIYPYSQSKSSVHDKLDELHSHFLPIAQRTPSIILSSCWKSTVSEIIFSRTWDCANPPESLVLDRSIQDGDLAWGIHALPVKVNRAMQLSLLALSHYVADHGRHNTTLFFAVTSKLRLAVIDIVLHRWTSSDKHTT